MLSRPTCDQLVVVVLILSSSDDDSLPSVCLPTTAASASEVTRCFRLLGYGILYITFSGALAPKGILPGAKFTLRPSHALSCIASITAGYLSSGREPNFVAWCMELKNFYIGRHLYLAGRPSRWASAHILVLYNS